MSLKRAKRQMLRLAMALIGPSGSGKTVGGLILAYGMMKEKYPKASEDQIWSLIGLVDTEHERSLIYEGMEKGGVMIGQFWHYDLKAPYSVERYTHAIMEMKKQGVEVVVIDSLSHAWMGEGGVLDYHDTMGGKFQSWNSTNKEAYFPLVSLATGESSGLHIINTIRSKQDHAMQPDESGKMQVVKLGLQPVQRDQFEYEFQIALNIDMDNFAHASKDNSDIFKEYRGKITPEHGAKLYQWLEQGVDIFAERRAAEQKAEEERLAMVAELRKLEAEYNLQETVQGLENHPTVNMKMEQMSMEFLGKTKGLMRQELARRKAAEAAQNKNEQPTQAEGAKAQ